MPETEKALVSVWQGSFRIFGVEVKCHVLSDGRRIIEADSMAALLDAWGDPKPIANEGELIGEVERFARWQRGLDA